MSPLIARDRRALGLGLLLCGTIVAAGRIVPAVRTAEAAARGAALNAVAEAQRQASHGGAGDSDPTLRSRCFEAVTHGAALESFTSRVSQVAQGTAVRLESVTPRTEVDLRPPIAEVSLSVVGTADAAAALAFIRELELSTPVIAIKRLRVAKTGATAADGFDRTLRIELTLAAVTIRAAGRTR